MLIYQFNPHSWDCQENDDPVRNFSKHAFNSANRRECGYLEITIQIKMDLSHHEVHEEHEDNEMKLNYLSS